MTKRKPTQQAPACSKTLESLVNENAAGQATFDSLPSASSANVGTSDALAKLLSGNGAAQSAFKGKQALLDEPHAPSAPAQSGPFANAVDGHTPGSFSVEMDNATYHAQTEYISSTGMKKLLRSPSHYEQYLNDAADKSGEANDIGSAGHCAILEPKVFAREYIAYKGRRQGKAWDKFKEEHSGCQIITAKDMDAVEGMIRSVKHFDEQGFRLWDVIRNNESGVEKSIFWTDPDTGVRCRVRPDLLTSSAIFDIKTIDDARPESVARQIPRQEYELSAAMYQAGAFAYTGKWLPFYWVFIEVTAPYGVWIHLAGPNTMRTGHIKFRRGVEAFKRLQDTGDWHGYTNAISVIEMPRYAMIEPETPSEIDAAANA